ncbi:hypothetical protein BSLG_005806 [Batrachochytrium salamandrivorans]|nr:hypothetical protein BSLG_005806 [Batrachochytrium salamandrivorans]
MIAIKAKNCVDFNCFDLMASEFITGHLSFNLQHVGNRSLTMRIAAVTGLCIPYEIIIDDEKRRVYDQYGEDGLKENSQQFRNPFDFSTKRAERRGPSINMILDVTLEEIFNGKEIDVEINRQVICPSCRGSGAKVMIISIPVRRVVDRVFEFCNVCNGRGKIVKSKCPVCDGLKVKRGSSQITVQVEKGMANDQELVYEGEADQSPDVATGHVKFTLRVAEHERFTRVGDNLYMNDAISLREALLGFERKFTLFRRQFICCFVKL